LCVRSFRAATQRQPVLRLQHLGLLLVQAALLLLLLLPLVVPLQQAAAQLLSIGSSTAVPRWWCVP
jgi:hypothetical protein